MTSEGIERKLAPQASNPDTAAGARSPTLSDLLGDISHLVRALWTDERLSGRDDARHVLLLDMLQEAGELTRRLEERATDEARPVGIAEAETEATRNLCPLCNTTVPARKLENLSRHEYYAHGDCGHFFANWTSAKMIRLGSEQSRARIKAAVRAQNAQNVVPLLTNLL